MSAYVDDRIGLVQQLTEKLIFSLCGVFKKETHVTSKAQKLCTRLVRVEVAQRKVLRRDGMEHL